MPPMVAYSKVILQDERTRLHLSLSRAQRAQLSRAQVGTAMQGAGGHAGREERAATDH